jgi:Ser/Thr protein kinase RdoA (MazF antagonist)
LAWQGANITLKVDSDADSFFLRLYREKGRTRTKIDAEIGAWLAFRLAGQTHVSVPVQLRGGEYVFSCDYEGRRRWAALFNAAPGGPPEANATSLRRLGEALGVMRKQMEPASECCGSWPRFPSGRQEIRGGGCSSDLRTRYRRSASSWLLPRRCLAAG